MSKKSVFLFLLFTLVGTLSNSPSHAQEIPEIPTPESITTQVVQGTDAVIPYAVSGENIVGLITSLVDFEVLGSSIIFNRSTGQIIIKNTPTNHTEVENILTKLREATLQQVEIEAQVATISSDKLGGYGLDYLGFDQAFDLESNNGWSANVGDTINSSSSVEALFQDITERETSTVFGQEFALGLANKRGGIQAVIDSIRSVAEVNTLAVPKITVFNNQRAHMRVADITRYVAEVDGDITTTSGDNLFFEIDLTVRDAPSGTLLDVTPTINKDGTITLELHPTYLRVDLTNTVELDTITATTTIGEAGDVATNTITLPEYTKQSIDTTVVIPDGGIAVLGGLIDEVETITNSGIPFLSDIPIMGRFFDKEEERHEKSYLVFFIKATSKKINNANGKITR